MFPKEKAFFFLHGLIVEGLGVLVFIEFLKEGFGLRIVVHLNHTLCELYSREPDLLVHLHLLDKLFIQELKDAGDAFPLVVSGKGLEIEVNPMGKVEVCAAALQDQGYEFLVF